MALTPLQKRIEFFEGIQQQKNPQAKVQQEMMKLEEVTPRLFQQPSPQTSQYSQLDQISSALEQYQSSEKKPQVEELQSFVEMMEKINKETSQQEKSEVKCQLRQLIDKIVELNTIQELLNQNPKLKNRYYSLVRHCLLDNVYENAKGVRTLFHIGKGKAAPYKIFLEKIFKQKVSSSSTIDRKKLEKLMNELDEAPTLIGLSQQEMEAHLVRMFTDQARGKIQDDAGERIAKYAAIFSHMKDATRNFCKDYELLRQGFSNYYEKSHYIVKKYRKEVLAQHQKCQFSHSLNLGLHKAVLRMKLMPKLLEQVYLDAFVDMVQRESQEAGERGGLVVPLAVKLASDVLRHLQTPVNWSQVLDDLKRIAVEKIIK